MSELAKSHIEITDESSYGTGVSPIIPLYIFATEQDKVIDESTGEIAPGTSKSVANELLVMTSQKDVTDTYGIPNYTTNDGTVQQGDELNEVGLYALYSALGSSSLAYALRADIDLKQLQATQAEPTSNVPNQTLWFDTAETSYGLFRANGNSRPALAWDKIENVLIPSENEIGEDGKPLGTYGANNDIAVVTSGNKQVIYENIASEWYELGSNDWMLQFPSSAKGKANGTYDTGAKITINGTEVTLSGVSSTTKIDDAVKDINNASIENIVAINENNALVIKNTATLLTITQDSRKALETLGFVMNGDEAVVNAVSLVHKTHSQVPNGSVQGSIWVKTTEPNNGVNYIMKQYNSTNDSWKTIKMPMYGSFIEAERVLGASLNSGSIIVKYDNEGLAETRLAQYGSLGLKVVGTVSNPTITSGEAFTIRTLIGTEVKTYTIRAFGTTVEYLAKAINNAKIPTIVADVTTEGYLRLVSSTGNTIDFQDVADGKILETVGIASGELGKWSEPTYIASAVEPTEIATDGTLWFNDALNVDIMVNDGDEWKGYKNMYECADIFVTSEQPTQHADGSALQEYDLWIDTAANEYPTMYRYYEGEWELVDNTDQTTPLGVVFADARENAGPAYADSTHTPFSTKSEDLLISDYVDPNCPNPQTYAAGMLLFNTLYSTNNVKEMTNEYQNAVKELGGTFTVGASKDFPTPGSSTNPKTTRWATISGNSTDGAGLFGRKAQRAMIIKALAEAINSNDEIRSQDYDFFFATCTGYPELDDELISLNTDKKEMFYIVSDSPARLAPKANDIIAWGSNQNNASAHGLDGRVIRSPYITRQYPPMGLTSNVDGSDIAVPTSVAKMKNLLVLPRGMFAAGTQYGQVKNLASVGYITDENEYAPVTVKDSLGEVIVAQSMNPIMPQRNTGLLFWGENTENSYSSSLSDEHAILTILRLKRELDAACLPFFFQPNTEALRRDFDKTLRSILNDYVSRDELYDYTLVTDNSVNTSERIGRKELWAEIAIEIVKGVEQIYIPIRIVRTGALSSSNS